MDTGWLYGNSARNIDVGSQDWSNPDNAKTENASASTSNIAANNYSDRLNVYNFGASIPANATITGIEYGNKRTTSYPNDEISDNEIYLMDDTTPKGNNKAVADYWPSSVYTWKYYGGNSDLWGASWTPTQVNASTFGLAVKAFNDYSLARAAHVDVLAVKIYYALPIDHLMIMGM